VLTAGHHRTFARRARRVAVQRIALGIVLAGVVVDGVAYSFFTMFNRFPFYDDEGKMLILGQRLLQGQAVFDELHCGYGPFYCFERWVLFGALGLPLGNDAFRAVSVLTWVLAAFMLALSAWRLARDTSWASGLAAIVWLAAIFHLCVLANEPGHPQELIVLLLAAAFLIAEEMWNRWSDATLILLGAITGALIGTKINVGAAFGLGLGMALVSLGPRRSITWTLLRSLGALAILAVPTILMRSRLADGYGPFCFLLTAALFPCCLLALFRIGPGGVGWRHLLLCGLGAALALGSLVGFAMLQGNTVAGLIQSLIIGNWHYFAGSKYGWPVALPRFTVYWSLLGAGLGLGVLLFGPPWPRFLWPLRLLVCAVIFNDAFVVRAWDSQWPLLALPLIWLLLVPPSGREPQAKGWFFRLLLTFTVCLQPIQIFPIPGSQLHIGTLMTVLAGAVLLVDLCHELRIADRPPMPAAILVRVAASLALLAQLALMVRLRVYEVLDRSYPLPSLTSVWSLLGVGMGLVVIWGGSWPRRWLRPLRLLASMIILGGVLVFGWDNGWMRFALPLMWLLLVPPDRAGREHHGLVFRLLLTGLVFRVLLTAWLEPLGVAEGPYHLSTLAMMLAGIVLLRDFRGAAFMPRPLRLFLAADLNIPLGSLALFFGGTVAIAAWLEALGMAEGPYHLSTLAMVLAGIVLLRDFQVAAFMPCSLRLFLATNLNILLGSLALFFGGTVAIASADAYAKSVPLDLRGCRWTRLSERDASVLAFLAANVEASSDCFVARIGLMSLHFWADRPSLGNVLPVNDWETIDPTADELLLSSHRNHSRMMFIDNPTPWYSNSYLLPFPEFVALQPSHRFLDFVGQNFKQLARVGTTRLLVRKDRIDLELYDCAFQTKAEPGRPSSPVLHLRLPDSPRLNHVAVIELVDLDRHEELGSTSSASEGQRILLVDAGGRTILPSTAGTADLPSPSRDLRVIVPASIRLEPGFPALRLIDSDGHRLLTLPVALEVAAVIP
jgi:hypothetical protein